MRLCRYLAEGNEEAALYYDTHLVNLHRLAARLSAELPRPPSVDLLDYLPPDGKVAQVAQTLDERFRQLAQPEQARLATPLAEVKLRVPIPQPRKVILLAGNYVDHIQEGGGQAAERKDTFPYFFWKPPSTTLTHPGDPVRIPPVSPNHIDWELELGVIMGKRCKEVSERDALQFVAGYVVCNDISDRKFQINPGRKRRGKDSFFDWLHGKWHDTFLPIGPCVRSAATVDNPQQFPMRLKVNGTVMQNAHTGQMIFPVAALVSILSTFITLEPGDTISTGTPGGVGHSRKPPVFLKAGDEIEAEITGIGVLRNPVA